MKTIVFSLALAAMTLTANNLNAQNQESRGVLGRGASMESAETGSKTLFSKNGIREANGGYSVWTEQFVNGTSGTYNVSTEQFGQNAPLGSGLFILAAAGAAYALKKRKMNK